jgi:hypothetical protein
VTVRIPSTVTLLRSPERAALAVLDAAAGVARVALLTAHPQLACEPSGDDLDHAARRLLRRLMALHAALDAYTRVDDAWQPVHDDAF